MNQDSLWEQRRKRIFEIIEIGAPGDYVSRAYDLCGALAIIVNLVVSVLYTFEDIRNASGDLLLIIEAITVAFFAIDYLLRVWTAKFLYPNLPVLQAMVKYLFSFIQTFLKRQLALYF